MASQSWFIMRGESRLGPFTHRGLITLATSGELAETDLVWCSDMQSPIPAVGVAGLFPEPEDVPAPAVPQPSPQQQSFQQPPASRAVQAAPSPQGFKAAPSPFILAPTMLDDLFPEPVTKGKDLGRDDDSRDDEEAGEEEDVEDDEEPSDDEEFEESNDAIPVVGRSRRRIGAPRKREDQTSLYLVFGGLGFILFVALVAVLSQNQTPPPRHTPSPASTVRVPRPDMAEPRPKPSVPRPAHTEKPPVRQPPPPPQPKFDSQPVLEEMAKSTVKGLLESLPSGQPRYRQLWESQLLTLLVEETKKMRSEGEVRAAATRICESWAKETRAFVTGGTESEQETKPTPAPESEPAPAPDDAEAMKPAADDPAAPE